MNNNLEAKLNNHHIFETKKAKNYSFVPFKLYIINYLFHKANY